MRLIAMTHCVLMVGASLGQPTAARQNTLDIESMRRATVTVHATTATGTSQGSGFLVSQDGIIATAAHVIEGATEATVTFITGEEYPVAGILSLDAARDFALLRIPGFGLPTVDLGNSDSVQVGTRVYAFGAPLGLEFTVSDGLLSSERIVEGTRVFQISVPVSPGSSGGPVTTEAGKVIGIVVSGILAAEARNLNFALPINYLRGALALAATQNPVALAQWAWQLIADRPSQVLSEADSRVVNDSLVLNWYTLDGIRLYSEEKGDAGLRWETTTRYDVSEDADGNNTLERLVSQLSRQTENILTGRDATDFWRYDVRTVLQLGQEHHTQTFAVLTALHPEVESASYVLTTDRAGFSLDSADVRRRESIPRGAYPFQLFHAVIGTLVGELPEVLHVWFVGNDGVAEPVRIEFAEAVSVELPVPRSGTACEKGTKTEKVRTMAIKAEYTIGATRTERLYSMGEPHFAINEDLKCVWIPSFR